MNLGYYQLLLSQHCDLHQRDMPNQSTPTSAPYTLSVSACARVCLLIGAWDGEGGGVWASRQEKKKEKCGNVLISGMENCMCILTQLLHYVGSVSS